MPEVRVSKIITGVEFSRLWLIAADITAYPTFIDSVLSVDMLECPVSLLECSGSYRARSAWTVLFNGNELQWSEDDHFDRASRIISFEQIEGDLAMWGGSLKFSENNEAITATYAINFDLGLPALAHLLHPLGEAAIRESCQQMLDGLSARAAGYSHAA